MKKSVICVETNEIFATATEAAKAFGCTVGNIWLACNGKQKTAMGKHFQYLEENELPTETEVVVSKPCSVKAKGKRSNGNTHAVFCIDDGTVYSSCADAAEANEVAQPVMSRTCNTKGSTSKGKRFCYVKDLPIYLEEISDAISKSAVDKEKYNQLLAKESRRNELKKQINILQEHIAFLEDRLDQAKTNLRQAEEDLMNL